MAIMRMILALGLLLAATHLVAAQAPGASGSGASGSGADHGPADSGSSTRPKDPTVSVDIVGEGTFNGAQVRVVIKNNESELLLCVNDIDIVGPTKFAKSTFRMQHSADKFLLDCMDPSSQFPVMYPLQREANWLDTWFTTYGYKEQIFAAVRYEVHAAVPPNGPVRYGTSNASGEYVYHTPIMGLIVGSLAGWFLLSIVIVSRASRTGKLPWNSLFTAGIGSLILTLVLRYGAGIQLPITLGVNDFYGALFVGLLSHRLASPLLEWLGLGDGKETGDVATNKVATADKATADKATADKAATATAAPGQV